MEVFFYQPSDEYLKFSCNLIHKLYNQSKRILIFAPSKDIAVIDDMLWSFNKTSFLPHACALSSGHDKHPIYITDNVLSGNINNADCVVSFVADEKINFVNEVYIIINNDNKNEARGLFKALKSKNIKLHYSEEV